MSPSQRRNRHSWRRIRVAPSLHQAAVVAGGGQILEVRDVEERGTDKGPGRAAQQGPHRRVAHRDDPVRGEYRHPDRGVVEGTVERAPQPRRCTRRVLDTRSRQRAQAGVADGVLRIMLAQTGPPGVRRRPGRRGVLRRMTHRRSRTLSHGIASGHSHLHCGHHIEERARHRDDVPIGPDVSRSAMRHGDGADELAGHVPVIGTGGDAKPARRRCPRWPSTNGPLDGRAAPVDNRSSQIK